MNRLYVAVSHHGLGHLAQTAPVLNALHALDPGLGFVLRTALPRTALEPRLAMPFEHVQRASDCNLVMHDAIRADVPASLAAYREFHRGWEAKVDAEARELDRLRVEAVFSNVGYLPLAAAQRAGLPSFALCSLNWADIFRHYLGQAAEAGAMLDAMQAAYAGARAFLRPEPAMAMADLGNTVAIAPVMQPGRDRRAELRARLGLGQDSRLVLIGMGGIGYRPPAEQWRPTPGHAFLVPDDWHMRHPSIHCLKEAGMAFRDVLASADAVITKPGYGTYVEAAAAGVPVLHIPRPDWPEAPYLNTWLDTHARALEIPEARLASGDLAEPLAALLARPACPPFRADGAGQAARLLLEMAG